MERAIRITSGRVGRGNQESARDADVAPAARRQLSLIERFGSSSCKMAAEPTALLVMAVEGARRSNASARMAPCASV